MHAPATAPLPRRALHRRVFALAGVYNIAWGIYTSLDPQWQFVRDFLREAPLRAFALHLGVGAD